MSARFGCLYPICSIRASPSQPIETTAEIMECSFFVSNFSSRMRRPLPRSRAQARSPRRFGVAAIFWGYRSSPASLPSAAPTLTARAGSTARTGPEHPIRGAGKPSPAAASSTPAAISPGSVTRSRSSPRAAAMVQQTWSPAPPLKPASRIARSPFSTGRRRVTQPFSNPMAIWSRRWPTWRCTIWFRRGG